MALFALATPVRGEQEQAHVASAHVASAEVGLPVLTGRVVDNASLLREETEAALSAKLAALDAETSDQLVIATIPSLGGRTIEAFGLDLGNGWGIGTKALDNGVLLIVAPAERRVRIEVGYGLESVLNDERAAAIIRDDILPDFRDGRMEEGIVAGTEAIIAVLRASPEPSLRGRRR